MREAARVRVPELLRVLVSGSESCKKHDKQLTFIVRVMLRRLLIVMMKQSRCLRSRQDRKELNYCMSAFSDFLVFIIP